MQTPRVSHPKYIQVLARLARLIGLMTDTTEVHGYLVCWLLTYKLTNNGSLFPCFNSKLSN